MNGARISRDENFQQQKGNPVSHAPKHPLLRKIASRRRRFDRANGQPLRFDFEELPPNVDRTRYSTLLGERILTPRETEVLYHVARGETDKEIADKLFVSRKTVSNHVSNILGKLAVANRRDAAKTAFRIGLI
jgi:DNA-binding NarL/FixJ family response regulator